MSRYIDIDDISLRKTISVGGLSAKALWRRIQQAPTIDIVRCKECRFWCCHDGADYDKSKFIYYCEVHGSSFEGDDFCSYGEREEE